MILAAYTYMIITLIAKWKSNEIRNNDDCCIIFDGYGN